MKTKEDEAHVAMFASRSGDRIHVDAPLVGCQYGW